MAYSVTKNTSLLTGASVLQKVISFVYFTLIARFVGVNNTGQYFFAIAFASIFTVVADFGLSSILTRETAKYPEKTAEYFNTVFWTKVFFGFLSYLLVVFFINILGYPVETKMLVYVSGITMFFDNIHSAFYSIFRARKNLSFESFGIIGSQFVTLVVGSAVLFSGGPMIGLVGAYTVASFCNVLYAGYFLRRVYNLKFSFVWNKNLLKIFLGLAIPFALAGIMSRLYTYADSMIMSKMLDIKNLGWWSVPYKISFAFQFIPVALSASVYPVMSSFSLIDKEAIGRLFEKSWRYLLTIVLPLSAGIFVLAERIIITLYGNDYLPAVAVLRVLLISLIFVFLSAVTGALLNAIGRQKIQTAILGVALFINIVLNLLLLPRIGMIGAGFSALVSNIILCSAGYYFSNKFIAIHHGQILKYFFQALLPAGLMAVTVYLLAQRINFFITIPVGALIYVSLLFLTGGVTIEMIKENKEKLFGKEETNL